MDLSYDNEPKMIREAMKDEALDRMEFLGLPAYANEAFKVDDYLTLSDVSDKICQSRVNGVPKDIKKIIKKQEDKSGLLIFHVIHTTGLYEGIETFDCLCVSPYGSDWDYERDLMEDRGRYLGDGFLHQHHKARIHRERINQDRKSFRSLEARTVAQCHDNVSQD